MKILAQSLSKMVRNSKDILKVIQSFTTYEGEANAPLCDILNLVQVMSRPSSAIEWFKSMQPMLSKITLDKPGIPSTFKSYMNVQ